MKRITHAQLGKLLMDLKPGATFAGVTLVGPARLKKRGNPPAGVRRVTRLGPVMLQCDYAANVRAQQAREGQASDFEASEAPWGTRIHNSCIIMHKPRGEEQMVLYVDLRPTGRARTTYYAAKGKLRHKEVAPFLVAKAKTNRQGVDKAVRVNHPRLNHIAQINLNGKQYRVVD